MYSVEVVCFYQTCKFVIQGENVRQKLTKNCRFKPKNDRKKIRKRRNRIKRRNRRKRMKKGKRGKRGKREKRRKRRKRKKMFALYFLLR